MKITHKNKKEHDNAIVFFDENYFLLQDSGQGYYFTPIEGEEMIVSLATFCVSYEDVVGYSVDESFKPVYRLVFEGEPTSVLSETLDMACFLCDLFNGSSDKFHIETEIIRKV